MVVALRNENPLRVVTSNPGAVSAALRERIFEKFATGGKQGGSDIGTYSALMLAKAQNGNICMATNDARNSTAITVSLPRHVFDPAHPGH